ncbi:hypothetical protein DPMN_122571 [Dreissena polymorpha]|uniref:Uncharacterized protein n=1 Tax=Dreissena polymorpha TaxID=45954 RepID=A0A9D4JUL8_DREPO|nr:hypothetical protein DPMN_122571 [Dreissena polymorpha]
MGFVPISYNSSRIPLSQRFPELSSRFCAVGTSVPSSSSALPLSVLEMVSGQSVYKDSNLSRISTSSSMVARRGQSLGRSTPSSSATFFIPNYGCKQGRVGCSSGTTQSDNFRVVVSSGVTATYQQSRNASSFSSSISFPVTSSRLVCDGVNRQHVSCDLHQGTGGNIFSLPVFGNQGITCSLQDTQYFSSGQIYSRSPQCPGGWVVSQTPLTTIRVDTSSRSDHSDLSHFRLSSGRPICDQTQPQASTVCESSVRSISVGSRCAFVRLGPTGRLRLIPTHSDSPSIGENQGEWVSHTPDCSLVAQESFVQRSSQSPVRLSQETPLQVRSSVSKRQTTCRSSNVPLTRFAIIRKSLQKKRFSVRASTLVASARRKSTRAVYDARWKLFSNWCIRGKIDPLNSSARRVADFLIYRRFPRTARSVLPPKFKLKSWCALYIDTSLSWLLNW